MATAIVFDDGGGRLGPLTDLRASFEVRTGALTTLERLTAVAEAFLDAEVAGVWTPKAIAALTGERLSIPVNASGAGGAGDVYLLNGRCVLPPEELTELSPGQALVEPGSGEVVAALLPSSQAAVFLTSGALPAGTKRRAVGEACLLHRPWDVIRFRDRAMDLDIEALVRQDAQALPEGVIAINDERVRISPDALVYPTVLLDAEHGAIVIEDGATVRPGAVIIGPAFIGRGSVVLDRALIKGHTAIGPVCKVAGEVGGTIMQGFANKAHDGHIGDSWIGEWVNLGAGTTNSNLLNTYGEVVSAVEPGAERERTGLKFLGSIIGDHTKTAIMTRLMTGAVIGTGCMIATTASPPLPLGRFEWITDERRQRFRFAKFIETVRAAMARRRTEPSAAYEARLKALCEETERAGRTP